MPRVIRTSIVGAAIGFAALTVAAAPATAVYPPEPGTDVPGGVITAGAAIPLVDGGAVVPVTAAGQGSGSSSEAPSALATTGADVITIAAIGGGMLVGGAVTLVLVRRRSA